MATAGKFNGSLLGVYIGGTKIAHGTNCSIDLSMATRDTTTKDNSGWQELAEGLRNISVSAEMVFAYDATYGADDLMTHYTGRTSMTVRFTTGVTGDKYWEFTGWLTSLNISASQEENVTASATFTSSGALTYGTEA